MNPRYHHPILAYLRHLPRVELSYVLQYGYVAFFLIILAGEFSGFIPVGILMIAMGALARRGFFSFPLLLTFATLATVLGNFVIYSIVREVGSGWVERKLKDNRFVSRVERHMKERPLITVFVSRFIGVITVPTTALAGLFRVSRIPFLLAIAAGNFICCLIYLTLGYFLSAAWEQDAHLASQLVTAVALLVMVGYVIYYLVVNRTRKESTERGRTGSADSKAQ